MRSYPCLSKQVVKFVSLFQIIIVLQHRTEERFTKAAWTEKNGISNILQAGNILCFIYEVCTFFNEFGIIHDPIWNQALHPEYDYEFEVFMYWVIMIISPLSIPGAAVVTFTPHIDDRGEFCRIFCADELKDILQDRCIVQINCSITKRSGIIRGMHFQYPPKAEMKFVQCTRGRVFDVLVDIRKGSSTFLSWIGIELSPDLRKMVVIPEGCAHGFQVLEDNSELLYLHTASYSPEYEGALSVFDPRIGVEWPLPPGQISERDQNHPFITEQFQGVIL